MVHLTTWKQDQKKKKEMWKKNHKSSFRAEWLLDKRFGDGLLFCPLWTNYHSFLSNLLQPSCCAKFRGEKKTRFLIWTIIVKLDVITKQEQEKSRNLRWEISSKLFLKKKNHQAYYLIITLKEKWLPLFWIFKSSIIHSVEVNRRKQLWLTNTHFDGLVS